MGTFLYRHSKKRYFNIWIVGAFAPAFIFVMLKKREQKWRLYENNHMLCWKGQGEVLLSGD